MLKLIPHSVSMVKRGYVRDPRAGFMKDPWVKVGTRKADLAAEAFNKRVDKVVAVLEKFAIEASRNFRYRKIYNARMVEFYKKLYERRHRYRHDGPSWADIMEEEDNRRAAVRTAYEARLIAMTDQEFSTYNLRAIAEIREHNDDVWPWIEFARGIRAKRAIARMNVVEGEKVWQEMSFANIGVPLNLHAKPAAAKVLRLRGPPSARPRNTFSALADSDSE